MSAPARPTRLLIIAGSDSSGGAGLQADIKTATALGCYAMAAVTAVTVQDTQGVEAIHPIPPELVKAQIVACLSDIGADAIKTGMLGSAETVAIVAETLSEHAKGIPLVVDPVLASSSGTKFLDARGIEALKKKLLPLATLATPNLAEAAILSGVKKSRKSARPAAKKTKGRKTSRADQVVRAVLVTGGDLETEELTDTLLTAAGTQVFRHARIDTPHTHGTGCTLATAIACGLGGGLALADAVRRAEAFVQEALRTAPGFGKGHGPLNHLLRVK